MDGSRDNDDVKGCCPLFTKSKRSKRGRQGASSLRRDQNLDTKSGPRENFKVEDAVQNAVSSDPLMSKSACPANVMQTLDTIVVADSISRLEPDESLDVFQNTGPLSYRRSAALENFRNAADELKNAMPNDGTKYCRAENG